MVPDDHPDRIQIAFDDHRLVNNAALAIPSSAATAGRQHPLCVATAPCTEPHLLEASPHRLFPLPLIPCLTHMATSLRWIRAKGDVMPSRDEQQAPPPPSILGLARPGAKDGPSGAEQSPAPAGSEPDPSRNEPKRAEQPQSSPRKLAGNRPDYGEGYTPGNQG